MKRRATATIAVLVAIFVGLWLTPGKVQGIKPPKTDGGHPSAKATAKLGYIAVLERESWGWHTILANGLKTASFKDLFVDVSLECGLYTRTQVASFRENDDDDFEDLPPNTSQAVADAAVKVRVLVDGVPVYPAHPGGAGGVTFCRRSQTLKAQFQGLLTNAAGQTCLRTVEVIPGSPGVPPVFTTTIDPTCLRPEVLELILDTMNANSYRFVVPDLPSGFHWVEVQARIDARTETNDPGCDPMVTTCPEAEANATIGHGSVTIEEVRMIKGEDFQL